MNQSNPNLACPNKLDDLEEKLLKLETENYALRRQVKHYEFERYKLREIQRLAKAGTWELNHLTYELAMSDELSRLLGNNATASNDFSWQNFLDFMVCKPDFDIKTELHESVIIKGNGLDFEHYMETIDGRTIYVRHHCKTFYNPIGQPLITVGLIHDFTDEHELQLELERCTVTDELTRLYNRRRIDSILKEQHDVFYRFGTISSYIMLDIDHFKQVNDSFGHQTGDEVLRKIARLIKGMIRNVDSAGRWGGEEFLIICPHTTLENAGLLAEKLRTGIMKLKLSTGTVVTASFGVAEIVLDETTEDLIKRVDDALYDAKEKGRNNVVKTERK